MRKIVLVSLLIACAFASVNCGYSSVANETIGQIKKVEHVTPIFCFNRTDIDLSLGVMRNGVGSMLNQDVWMFVDSPESMATIKKANETGAIVKVTYDQARITFCTSDKIVRSVEIVE